MKKENITITMDAAKLQATKRYMLKKHANIEKELSEALEKLYEKYVPAQVREYIDETADDIGGKKPQGKPKVAVAKENEVSTVI